MTTAGATDPTYAALRADIDRKAAARRHAADAERTAIMAMLGYLLAPIVRSRPWLADQTTITIRISDNEHPALIEKLPPHYDPYSQAALDLVREIAANNTICDLIEHLGTLTGGEDLTRITVDLPFSTRPTPAEEN
jgi:hypothetical protein